MKKGPKKKKLSPFLWAWLAATALCYGAVWVSPAKFWPAAFIAMFGIPAVLLGNLLLALVGLFTRNNLRIVWVGLGALAFGWPFIQATVAWPNQEAPVAAGTFSVVSFNMGKRIELPDRARFETKKYYTKKAVKWAKSTGADVLMLQEVFNYPIVPEFRVLNQLRKAGYPYRFFSRQTVHTDSVGAGMAIASKYPLFHKTVVWGPAGSLNMIQRVDANLPQGQIRLINVHLQSIRLSGDELSWQEAPHKRLTNFRSVIRKMRSAYLSRSAQVDALVAEVQSSKLPIILGGDFNDTPYSYTYWRLRALLSNSFEDAGQGLGSTFNGKIRAGLRIDQQFFKPPLVCDKLSVIDSVPYSDHFPLLGQYHFSGGN